MLPTSPPEGTDRGVAMETNRREASFSYDPGLRRRGRREHWRPVGTDPRESPSLRHGEPATIESVEVFPALPAVLGTDAA